MRSLGFVKSRLAILPVGNQALSQGKRRRILAALAQVSKVKVFWFFHGTVDTLRQLVAVCYERIRGSQARGCLA
jgi:hypothetical protein